MIFYVAKDLFFYENVIQWHWNTLILSKYGLLNQPVWNIPKEFITKKSIKKLRSGWLWKNSTFIHKKYKLPINIDELYIFGNIKP